MLCIFFIGAACAPYARVKCRTVSYYESSFGIAYLTKSAMKQLHSLTAFETYVEFNILEMSFVICVLYALTPSWTFLKYLCQLFK